MDSAAASRLVEIEQLLTRGKARRAVDLAKDLHKACARPETEAMLVRAYRARVEEMLRQGMTQDAEALATLVNERYPASRAAWAEVKAAVALRSGSALNDLARLADTAVSAAERERLEGFVRCHVADPRQVADFAGLPPNHTLRVEASAIVRALAAVTAGRVTDAAVLALPEVSRQSPLAAWKLFVRALARFYGRQDEDCRKCLAALAPDSVPARLAPVLLDLLDAKQPQGRSGAVLKLATAVAGDLPQLRRALADLDAAFRSGRQKEVLQAATAAVRECERTTPELLERLRQHVWTCALAVGIPTSPVARALGAVPIKNAPFWRFYARAMEERSEAEGIDATFDAGAAWEEFRRHAIHQGWFAVGSPEEAAVVVHMANLVASLPWAEYADECDSYAEFYAETGGLADEYSREERQPPAVMACAPPATAEAYFVYPDKLFARACRATPTVELFSRWLAWTRTNNLGERAENEVASAWHAALPNDPRPLLALAETAETRNALGKALKYLKAAETLDGMNAEVRRGRPRLLVATAVRHLQKLKVHLVEKDLTELAALPQMRDGDRPALVAGLRWATDSLAGRQAECNAAMQALTVAAGDHVTAVYIAQVIADAVEAPGLGREVTKSMPETALRSVAFLHAAARVQVMCADLRLPFGMPRAWAEALPDAVDQADASLTDAHLLNLTRFILNCQMRAASGTMPCAMAPLAYRLTGHGLKRADGNQAHFLFLRGKSLLVEDARAPQRGLECLRAARVLAARQRETALVDEAMETEWRYRFLVSETTRGCSDPNDHLHLLSEEAIQRVLATERAAADFPGSGPAPCAAAAAPPTRRAPRTCRMPRSTGPDPRQNYLPGLDFGTPAVDEPVDVDEPMDFDEPTDDEPIDLDDIQAQGLALALAAEGMPPALAEKLAKLYAKYGEKAMDLMSDPKVMARLEPDVYAEIAAALERTILEDEGFVPPAPRRRKGK